jgi:hypothetical protein
MEAMRALKRRLSDIVYRHMINDTAVAAAAGPGGQQETPTDSKRDRLTSPHRLFGEVTSRPPSGCHWPGKTKGSPSKDQPPLTTTREPDRFAHSHVWWA